MNKPIETPVLLIGFNRPEIIQESFSYIKAAKPKKLFVAVDGPRLHINGENILVENVKNIVKQVDWDCDVKFKFNNENLGAELTVSLAVSWVLATEETVIVLEDDIIAPISFLNFAQEMLNRYANNENVYMISSNQWTPIYFPNDEDYLFGRYGHTWGWATWRRAWKNFDFYIDDFDEFLNCGKLELLVNSKAERKHWLRWIKGMKEKGPGNSTWDYCWSYIRFKENGLSIIPRANLTSNIGVLGLHARGKTEHHFKAFDEAFIVQKHPVNVLHNLGYDNYHFKNYINRSIPFTLRVFRKAKKLLKLE
jgi:hypothetical protein